jgi:hypothetical protein
MANVQSTATDLNSAILPNPSSVTSESAGLAVESHEDMGERVVKAGNTLVLESRADIVHVDAQGGQTVH